MNKNLQSPTKLTEFPPLQQEEKPQSVGQFISKFFKISRTEETSIVAENISEESTWTLPSESRQECLPNMFTVDLNEGRSLPNVLKRISNLLALKSNNLQDYADTELKQYWMPDSISKECYECAEKFTTFRRRHHCRVCGQIFCSQCCNQQIPGKIFGCTGDLRVCTYCCKIVLSYLQSSDFGADLRHLQENLQSKFGESSGGALSPNRPCNLNIGTVESNESSRRKISVGYQEEKFASGSEVSYLSPEEKCKALRNSVSLRNLFDEMCKPTTGVQFDTHKYRLRTYTDCFLGSELVDWLIFQQKAKTRIQASAICQALLDGGYFECISEPSAFVDGNVRYKKGTISSPVAQVESPFEMPLQEEPSWVKQIPHELNMDTESELPLIHGLSSSESYMLDLNLKASTVYLSKPTDTYGERSSDGDIEHCSHETTVIRPTEQLEVAPESGWFNASSLREENGEREAYERLTETYEQHEQSLLKQLLSSNGLPHTWIDVILPLVRDIVAVIRPDKNHDAIDLDIRHYVQFKKLPGGAKTDSCLVNGVVCSKNVAHKDMAVDIENPKILLLQCSIVYQRTEGRLMSLEPVLMQENAYLRHVCSRIEALQPDVVLVHRSVSRLAQDMLRQSKVTLVYNVKQSVMDRLARCTQADIVTAVDSHIGRPNLGTCKRFYLKSFNCERAGTTKSLMFFEGLPCPWLGGTVLLRGGARTELTRFKKVARLLLLAAYNWRLEKSFLMDEFALPPDSKCEFLDDSKENSPKFPATKQFPDKDGYKKQNNNDSKKVVVETIEDFTDPLHSYDTGSTDYHKSTEKFTVAELPFSNNFRKQLDDTILCISPYIVFSVPYLETDCGKKCELRRFFPKDMYYSQQFEVNSKKQRRNTDIEQCLDNKLQNKNTLHPFLTAKITNVENPDVQNKLALFRACGGQYQKKETLSVVQKDPETPKDAHSNSDLSMKDVLDPANHQRLAVLFCSFSHESHNAPAFCVNPWVVYMDFYGRNDIPLGCFLERYCFRSTYACPSKSCDTPMVNHVRRFVHNAGCVSISLTNFDNEFSEEDIVMWTWCTKCQSVSPVVSMSSDTWSYPFAKFLELKFHGDVFSRRGQNPCQHSLHHDHYQYFGYKNYVASFKYTSITIWEICLPKLTIDLDYSFSKMQDFLTEEVKSLSQKAHDKFAMIHDKLSSVCLEEADGQLVQSIVKEQMLFKQKVEEIQLKLTSPTVENKEFDPSAVRAAYWRISDSILKAKAFLIETVESWNLKLAEVMRKREGERKRDKSIASDVESPTNEIMEAKDLSIESILGDSSPADGAEGAESKGEGDSQNESEKNDKSTVKNILDKFLAHPPNTGIIQPPFSNQEHYTLPAGVFMPVMVYESEPSSIVAYALNSWDYKRALEELTSKKCAEQSPSPVSKRKNNLDKDKSESDEKASGLLGFLRSKESKTDLNNPASSGSNEGDAESSTPEKSEDSKKNRNCNIEVQFQDGTCRFFCTVYLAEKFSALRSMFVSIGEEGYIRSLCRSIQWKVRGGKSGSNFAKTSDDRFILKDLPKTEVQLFLEFAPNYFAYMEKCYTTKQPTLLAKTLGIYQITFKNTSNVTLKTDILVMENLFYNREVSQKFDLKGSVRNRLVVPDKLDGEIVFLDENLLKMTCESPLYVLPHSKEVLMAAIQNDTEFLSTHSVMDYSLVVGLDATNKELVVGIIDYIRTFTWDKRLEHILKKIGGQGKLPTIVSPEEYQKRFIEAMHKYFLEVPDHWAGLDKGLEF